VTRLSTRVLMTTVATAAVTGVLLFCAGGAALASNAGPVASVVNADDPSKTSGTSIDPVQITAPAACNSAATRHVTKITAVVPANAADRAAAKAWVGDNLYATASVGLPGPLTVQSSNSWQGLAEGFRQKLVPGRYDLVLRCQDNLGSKIYQEWHASVTFTSRTAWKGSIARATKVNGTARGGTAVPGGTTPSGGTAPSAPAGTSGTGGTGGTATSPPSSAGAAPSALPSESAADATDRRGGATSGEAVKGISLIALLVVAGSVAMIAIRRARREDSPGQNDQ
jgi:hypothetical protein